MKPNFSKIVTCKYYNNALIAKSLPQWLDSSESAICVGHIIVTSFTHYIHCAPEAAIVVNIYICYT